MRTIVALGEGQSDCESIPTLLTRLAQHGGFDRPVIKRPIRFRRNRIEKEGELHRLLDLACRKLQRPGGILILLDADEDCPAEIGPRIERAAASECAGIPVAVVLAKRMFESWLLAGAEGLVEGGEIEPTDFPEQPEEIRNAKDWLSERIFRAGG